MAIASVFGNYELFHGLPSQNIYPSQFAPSNPHLEQPRLIIQIEHYKSQTQEDSDCLELTSTET